MDGNWGHDSEVSVSVGEDIRPGEILVHRRGNVPYVLIRYTLI